MAVFNSPCNSLADFSSVNQAGSETVSIDTGRIKMVLSTIANEISVRKDLSSQNVRDLSFKYQADSAASINGEHTIYHCWDNSAGYTDLVQIRITPVGSQYRFMLRDGASFANSRMSTVKFNKGTQYTVRLIMSDYSYGLYVDGVLIIEWFGKSNEGKHLDVSSFGKFYSSNYSGSQWFDDVNEDIEPALPSAPSTIAAKLKDVYDGWKKRYLRSDGAIVRPNPEGVDGAYSPWSDVVSEGQAYGLMFAVQASYSLGINERTTFDLIENWAYNHLDRRNNSMSTGANLMGWHYDDVGNTMYDWNWATDADIDRMKALYWAHAMWGSSGSINYLSRANAIWSDLKTYAFRSSGGNYYQTTDSFQGSANPFEVNLSYHDPNGYKIAERYNPSDSTFVAAAVTGTYDLITKATDNSGGLPTTAGLVPDWLGYNTSTSDVGTIDSRATKYSYDAFRTPMRIYWHWKFNADSRAQSYLSGVFKTFLKNEWDTYGKIGAEYNHDGTTIGDHYEKTMMTWIAYFAFLMASDSTYSTVFTSKLADTVTYKQDNNGGFLADNTNTSGQYRGAPSYFNNSWAFMEYMTKENLWTDITAPPSGPSSNPAKNGSFLIFN